MIYLARIVGRRDSCKPIPGIGVALHERDGVRSSRSWRPRRCPMPAGASEAAPVEADPALPEAAELERLGAVIGEVFIYNENIFDLEDPEENKGLYRLANKLHIRTQPQVIRQQLLFKSGDPYSQRLLDESARILRSARYLYDASVRPVAFKDGRVDIAVTTRDVWTLNPGHVVQSQRRREHGRCGARRAQPARHRHGSVDRPHLGRRSRLDADRVQGSARLRHAG